MSKNNGSTQNNGIGGGRLDALAALAAGILREVAKEKESEQVHKVEDRAVIAMVSTGMPQTDVAKLLGIGIVRVNKTCKGAKK